MDDASNKTYLGHDLEDYVSKLSISVQIVRSHERIGLIKARLLGMVSKVTIFGHK